MAASTTVAPATQEQKQQGMPGPTRKMKCKECGLPHFAQSGMASDVNVCPKCIERNHKDWIESPKAMKGGGKKK